MTEKLRQLNDTLTKLAPGGLCIAFSGGVDSALLLKAACLATDNARARDKAAVHAVTLHTPFHAPLERAEAVRMTEEYGRAGHGVVHKVIAMDAMPDEVMRNPPDRCYRCKRVIFEAIRAYADEHGLTHVLDGTNADDLTQYRPGLCALRELGILSPLAELGFHKADIRALAAELGLVAADKPSAPCLATRFPYDTPITAGELRAVEAVEDAVKALEIRVVRARVHGDTVRLEVLPDSFGLALEGRESLLAAIKKAGFTRLTLDLEGYRSGSFDTPYKTIAYGKE